MNKIAYYAKKIVGILSLIIKFIFSKYNKIWLIIIPDSIFIIFSINVLLYSFLNIKDDTTYLTNYCFAIIIIMASVCFSWVKVLKEEKEAKTIVVISQCGEMLLHSAVIFLLASSIKFISFHLDYMLFFSKTTIQIFSFLLHISYCYCFLMAYTKTYNAIFKINRILYERLHLGNKT
jgi:hypothetical protein